MGTQTMPRNPGAPRQAPDRRTAPVRPRPGARPVTAPRHTRPLTGPITRPAPRPAAPGARRSRPRTPFILLLVGLLGGALVSLLVISTTLAQGAFQITNLQQQSTNLARQEQTLTDEVAKAGNPSAIASEASQLGMRQDPNLKFIDTKTGKIVTGKVTKSEAAFHAPGYTP
jgi:hypothetical protein